MGAIRLSPSVRQRSDGLLLLMLGVSALLHGGALYAGYRWGDCLCRIGKVVCPKICFESEARIDLELKPLPPPPPAKPIEKRDPIVIAKATSDRPLAAPKRGRVVLPDEALQPRTEPPKETTARLPSLPEDVVVRQSDAQSPVVATPEIFGRAGELSAGPPGEFGLGGTGKATGAGPFGTTEDGGGSAGTSPVAPSPPPPPNLEPPPKPRGPTRPPKVLNWTDPPYPEQARQQGVEGTVVLKLTVRVDGVPGDVRVSRSSGHAALDEAALAHVRRARFSPALKDGKAVPMPMTFRVKFHLVNA